MWQSLCFLYVAEVFFIYFLAVSIYNLSMGTTDKKKFHLNPFQVIIISFVALILVGAVLLVLPISCKNRVATPFNKCLFTSVSAVCVTGLVVVDTATHWSVFGQAVILLLIQIGGLGVITSFAALMLLFGGKISLFQKTAMQEATSAQKMGGIVRLTIFILITTFATEAVGACALMGVFVPQYGGRGVWMAIFHSVSAFCNAGFDIMGTDVAPFASMTGYVGNPLLNITLMALIFVGGIGFLTIYDIGKNKCRFSRYSLQTKIVLISSAVLTLAPALYFFFAEFTAMPVGERVLASLFASVAPRTAGFNTVDTNAMSSVGKALTVVLMLVGGSPGSTAGGIKTTTFALLFACAFSVFRKRKDTRMLHRRISDDTVKTASALFLLYLFLFLTGGAIISLVEDLPLGSCLFETASAIGTVGLTCGITPSLGIASQIVLMLLMFVGRVGGLTLLYSVLSNKNNNLSKLPQGNLAIG